MNFLRVSIRSMTNLNYPEKIYPFENSWWSVKGGWFRAIARIKITCGIFGVITKRSWENDLVSCCSKLTHQVKNEPQLCKTVTFFQLVCNVKMNLHSLHSVKTSEIRILEWRKERDLVSPYLITCHSFMTTS